MSSAKILVYVEGEPSEKKVLRVPLEQLHQGECVSTAIMRLFDPSGLKYVPGAFEIKCLNADEEETGVLASAEQVVNAGRYMLKPLASAHVMEKQRAAFLQSVPTATISATTLTVTKPSDDTIPSKSKKGEALQQQHEAAAPEPVVVAPTPHFTNDIDPELKDHDVHVISTVVISILTDNIRRNPERLTGYALKGPLSAVLCTQIEHACGQPHPEALVLVREYLDRSQRLHFARSCEGRGHAAAYVFTDAAREVVSLASRVATYAFLKAVMVMRADEKDPENALRLSPKFGATVVEGKAILEQMAKFGDKKTLQTFLKFHQLGHPSLGETNNHKIAESVNPIEKEANVSIEAEEQQQTVLVSVSSDDDEEHAEKQGVVQEHAAPTSKKVEELTIPGEEGDARQDEDEVLLPPPPLPLPQLLDIPQHDWSGPDMQEEVESFMHRVVRAIFATPYNRLQLLHWCTSRGLFWMTSSSQEKVTPHHFRLSRPLNYPRILEGGKHLQPLYILPDPGRAAQWQERFDRRPFQASSFLKDFILDGSVALDHPHSAPSEGCLHDDLVAFILFANARRLSLFDERATREMILAGEQNYDLPRVEPLTNSMMSSSGGSTSEHDNERRRRVLHTDARPPSHNAHSRHHASSAASPPSISKHARQCNRCLKMIPKTVKFVDHNAECKLLPPVNKAALNDEATNRSSSPVDVYDESYDFSAVSRGRLKCKECGACIRNGVSVRDHLDRECRLRR